MDFVANVTGDIRMWGDDCGLKSQSITATYSIFFIDLLLIHLATKFLHEFLRRYGQPRIVSDFIVGTAVGNISWIGNSVSKHVGRVLMMVGEYAMMCYMFVLGLEMEPRGILMRQPGWEAIVAYVGIFSTVVLTFAFYPLLTSQHLHLSSHHDPIFVSFLALVFSNTCSPILTRITADLRLGRTHFGRLVIGSAIINDMVTTTAFAVVAIIAKSPLLQQQQDLPVPDDVSSGLIATILLAASWSLLVILAQTMFIVMVVPRFAQWINRRNPEGKPMKGIDLAMSLALVLALTQYGTLVNFNPTLNSFLVGLAFPKEGRLSNMLITKINFFISTFGLPYYLCHIGLGTSFAAWTAGRGGAVLSISKLALITFVATAGKVTGTVFPAMLYGLAFKEALALGILLNVKGYLHIFSILMSTELLGFGNNTVLVTLIYIIATIVLVPPVVRRMVKRVKGSVDRPKKTIQGLEPSGEVHMVIGILGPQNVPLVISIAEAMRSRSSSLTVYAMDLIELTDRTATALIHEQERGGDGREMEDKALLDMREDISETFEKYVDESDEDGLTVVRLSAVSSLYSMHDDVCHAALDTASVLILMPFHRSCRPSGGMEILHHGLRKVNRKVLQHSPCSVGVVVDRSLNYDNDGNRRSASSGIRKVAVIFIGGCDDREALHFAGHVARRPSFALTTLRFLQESGAEMRLARTRGLVVDKALQEKEMQLDDECFARFFDNHIASGRVSYLEKYVSCGADAVVVLKTLEGQYDLFVVGRGGTRNPVLTAGLDDWAEFPELGPVGDILASADFSDTASVLIIQQHDIGREEDSSDDESGAN